MGREREIDARHHPPTIVSVVFLLTKARTTQNQIMNETPRHANPEGINRWYQYYVTELPF
jgi:hypothetical protein